MVVVALMKSFLEDKEHQEVDRGLTISLEWTLVSQLLLVYRILISNLIIMWLLNLNQCLKMSLNQTIMLDLCQINNHNSSRLKLYMIIHFG